MNAQTISHYCFYSFACDVLSEADIFSFDLCEWTKQALCWCSHGPCPQIRPTSARQFIPVPESPPSPQPPLPSLSSHNHQRPTTFTLHFLNLTKCAPEKRAHTKSPTMTVLLMCLDYLVIIHDEYWSVYLIIKHDAAVTVVRSSWIQMWRLLWSKTLVDDSSLIFKWVLVCALFNVLSFVY